MTTKRNKKTELPDILPEMPPPPAPTNPDALKRGGLLAAVAEQASRDDLTMIARILVAMAREGNIEAARLVLAYCVGEPRPSPCLDHLADQELKRLRRHEERCESAQRACNQY